MKLYDVAHGWGYELRETNDSFVAVCKAGRSWKAETFTSLWPMANNIKEKEFTRLNEILKLDPDAIIIGPNHYKFYRGQREKDVYKALKECVNDDYYRLDRFISDYWKSIFRSLTV